MNEIQRAQSALDDMMMPKELLDPPRRAKVTIEERVWRSRQRLARRGADVKELDAEARAAARLACGGRRIQVHGVGLGRKCKPGRYVWNGTRLVKSA